jgi:hypothetical protein
MVRSGSGSVRPVPGWWARGQSTANFKAAALGVSQRTPARQDRRWRDPAHGRRQLLLPINDN